MKRNLFSSKFEKEFNKALANRNPFLNITGESDSRMGGPYTGSLESRETGGIDMNTLYRIESCA